MGQRVAEKLTVDGRHVRHHLSRSMTAPLAVSAEHARRFLVRRHLLVPPRSLPAEPASVLAVMNRLGSLQFDPLDVPGARNHDLVLHARIAGYEKGWCDTWLYGPDRRLIEMYNKMLSIVPMTELPHYALAWTTSASHYNDRILAEERAVAEAILERIRTDGPLSTSDFKEHGHSIDWWWAPTRAARAVLEALFASGRVGIARREGSRRFYDLIERIVPPDLLAEREPEHEANRHRLLSRFRAIGLMAATGQAELFYATGATADRRRHIDGLVDDGTLVAAEVEGQKALRYLLAEELPILEMARREATPAAVTFLAPLDPFIWDRRLMRTLFGFDYIWEVYTPAAKRRFGYYALPILFGDRLVGRIEPRREKANPDLRIAGIWFEDGFSPVDEPGFIEALADAVEAYRRFTGAPRVTWPRTKTGRHVAAALRGAADARAGG
jgi:uncharacterized protein YcaQ